MNTTNHNWNPQNLIPMSQGKQGTSYMQDIETNPREKPTVARVKWLETSPNEFFLVDEETNERAWLPLKDFTKPYVIKSTNEVKSGIISISPSYSKYVWLHNLLFNIKHLSFIDRLKRMFSKWIS